MTNFRKTKVVNNWGHYTYFLGNEELLAGDTIEVELKDGSIVKRTIKADTVETVCGEQGGSYTAISEKLYVDLDLQGMKVPISLDKLKIRLVRRVKPKVSTKKPAPIGPRD